MELLYLFPLTKRVLEVIGGTDLMYVFCSVALYTGVFFAVTLVCYPERISCRSVDVIVMSRARLTLITYLYGGI